MSDNFKGKTIVISGHTGFKGSWLTAWLKHLGAQVIGVALDPPTEPSHFIAAQLVNGIVDHRIDIRNRSIVEEVILDTKPDFIFHMAAQALVRQSYENPIETWQTNVFGTLHVLEAMRKLENSCAVVIITSDKCYNNVEWIWGYKETDALGGPDPYSASKGAAELAIHSHIKSFFPKSNTKVRIASARAGNVIGGGDWASDRIVPDCIRAWSEGKMVELRNPHATRPWQHVLEPLSGYLVLAASLVRDDRFHGESFNFGPSAGQNYSVLELVKQMSSYWDQVRWQDISEVRVAPHECGLLKLNCDKAMHYLGWKAVLEFEETVKMTAQWYREYYCDPESILAVTQSQIKTYVEMACLRGLTWAQNI